MSAPEATCPLQGCGRPAALRVRGDGSLTACAGGAACGGVSAKLCTQAALDAWTATREADRPNDPNGANGANEARSLSCVARMMGEACTLGDPRACAYGGRLWVDGHGVPRDVKRGLDLLGLGCDGGVAWACVVGSRFLADAGDMAGLTELAGAATLRARFDAERSCLAGQPEACYQVGVFFYFGHDAFPRSRLRAAEAYDRGCVLGDPRACNNLGDALAYGEGIPRDVDRAASLFEKACHAGEALGCSNLGYMLEHGQGKPRDAARARSLYLDACATGDVYGCLHAEMLSAEAGGAPREATAALEYWRRACDRQRMAKACAFVGVIYEDGPDGMARDEQKSGEAMSRACTLGDGRACEWVKVHSGN